MDDLQHAQHFHLEEYLSTWDIVVLYQGCNPDTFKSKKEPITGRDAELATALIGFLPEGDCPIETSTLYKQLETAVENGELITRSEDDFICVESVKEWFSSKGLRPAFFFPENAPDNLKLNIETLPIPEQREQVLKQLIADKGIDVLVSMGRLGVWQQLTQENPVLFTARDNSSDSTIKKFFDSQSQIAFPRGR